MSDLDTRFERLRAADPPAPFAPAEAVRRRGRQRARRQVAAVAAGVALAVTGAGVALAVTGPPQPVPPAAAPTAEQTAPTAIPPGWLLTADDLGPGRWRTWDGPEWESEPLGWPPESCFEGPWAQAATRQVDTATASFSTGPVPGSGWVAQVLALYEPGGGGAAFAELREAYARCEQPDQPMAVAYTIVDSGFAGDESLLVQEDQLHYGEGDAIADEPYVTYRVVVRVGDAVAIVRSYDGDLEAADPDLLRSLAQRAAVRIDPTG